MIVIIIVLVVVVIIVIIIVIIKSSGSARAQGNCYYRAVLFAWLEHCLALGLQQPLQTLANNLHSGKEDRLDKLVAPIGPGCYMLSCTVPLQKRTLE